MKENLTQSGSLNFSIDSSLLFQLGEQLVAKPSIALAELVKNAYDADATKVTITLENVDKPGGTIIVEDDGHGMTIEEIKNNWMRIATDLKKKNPISRIYGRPLTGAKGIGRIAARKLGDKLTLQSIAKRDDGVKEAIIVEFDWKNKFTSGEDLSGVTVDYNRREASPQTETGVSLFIGDARDAWKEEDISELRQDLLKLQSPFPDLVIKTERIESINYQPDPGFNLYLDIAGSKELENLSGSLGEEFLKAAWAKLEGRIDENGKAHFILHIFNGEHDSLEDDTTIYEGLENARFRIYFMVYRKEYFEDFDFGVREATKKGRQEGGIRIYLDKFRVAQYGEEGDDWLRLDEHAAKNLDLAKTITTLSKKVLDLRDSLSGRPFLLTPRNNQLFGAVVISQEKHSNLEINISRERLIETQTVAQLRRFLHNGIYWMTLKYAAFTAEERAKRRREKKTQTVPEIIEEAKSIIASQAEIPEDRRHIILWNLDKAIEQSKEDEEDRISEISMLRILASAGTTISIMNHQLQAFIGAVSQTEQDLRRLKPEVPSVLYPKYDDIIVQVAEWHTMVKLQVSQLEFLLTPDSRQRRRRLALHEVVENVRKPMSYYMDKYGVSFENNVPHNLRTPPIYQSELYAILINILSNALKAIYEQPLRKIAVEAGRKDSILYLRMMDTGVGLPAERREISFRPFVTTSVPNPLLGVGTGLGLKVVRDILELYAGTARFIDAPQSWKTCIEIVLPERGTTHDN